MFASHFIFSKVSTSTWSTAFFFFSSRRRHTRCSRDWSSDVCSSDLHADRVLLVRLPWFDKNYSSEEAGHMWHGGVGQAWREGIGRGSGRGRGEVSGGGGSFKKKKN